MALTTVPGLFGASLMTPEQVQQQELQGLMISPAQMAQLSLPQQITATIANAGSGIGYGAGRMLGGQTADMARANSLNQIMQDISSAGFTSDAEMYTELSRRLAQAGMSQDAMQARAKALEAKRAEQSMALQEAQNKRAEEELTMRKELHPLNKSRTALEIESLNKKMQPLEEQIAAEQAKPSPNAAKIEGLQRELQDAKDKQANEKLKLDAQLKHWSALEAQGARSNQLAAARLELEQYSRPAVITMPSKNPADLGKLVPVNVGWLNPKTGKIMGQDGNIYNSAKEAGLAQNITTDTAMGAPVPEQNKAETKRLEGNRKPLSSFGAGNAAGNMVVPEGY